MDAYDWDEMTHQEPTAAPITDAEIRTSSVGMSCDLVLSDRGLQIVFPETTEARLPANDPIMTATFGDDVDGT
jgi:hypothetical protein